jgi:hypothetical protein
MTDLDPELRAPPPRRIRVRRDATYDAWGFSRVVGLLLCGSAAVFGAGWALSRSPVTGLGIGLGVFGGLGLLAVLPLSLVVSVRIIRDALLVKYGAAAVGRITANLAEQDANGFGGYHHVTYLFSTQDGAEVHHTDRRADKPLWECAAGDAVTVLYAPSAPRVNVPYVCALFRAIE